MTWLQPIFSFSVPRMNDLRILLTVSDDDEDCRFCVGENTEISRVRIFRLYRVIALLDPIVSIISSRRDPSVAVSSAIGKVRSRFLLGSVLASFLTWRNNARNRWMTRRVRILCNDKIIRVTSSNRRAINEIYPDYSPNKPLYNTKVRDLFINRFCTDVPFFFLLHCLWIIVVTYRHIVSPSNFYL